MPRSMCRAAAAWQATAKSSETSADCSGREQEVVGDAVVMALIGRELPCRHRTRQLHLVRVRVRTRVRARVRVRVARHCLLLLLPATLAAPRAPCSC
eukprot:scaffold74816_cov44-Phaeocystis_antarctica.AAC.2